MAGWGHPGRGSKRVGASARNSEEMAACSVTPNAGTLRFPAGGPWVSPGSTPFGGVGGTKHVAIRQEGEGAPQHEYEKGAIYV